MALAITTQPKPQPPRILLYGVPGIGKTTTESHFPKPLLIPVAAGADNLSAARTPTPTGWLDFLAMLEDIAASDYGYRTLVIDSVSALQELLFAHVYESHGVAIIELAAGGYGKGYIAAADHWRCMLQVLDRIRTAKNMIIVGIDHMATGWVLCTGPSPRP